MKKRLLIVIIPLLLLSFSAGCGTENDRSSTTSHRPSQGAGVNQNSAKGDAVTTRDPKTPNETTASEKAGAQTAPAATGSQVSEKEDPDGGLIARSSNAEVGNDENEKVLDELDQELQGLVDALDSVQGDLGDLDAEEAD